ncbi:3-phosphoshikimate 1-carboxyvinyltransferase [Pajaroellobacter abortibovis]|uniref:3-phosphoshikimate 1-carboxyvinyltransferase n=1 Tax=Pajaroellobacter abortibovis TaxID=1882918 RepID=A0A1L6MXD4_9BACT|nr:3-phosphoshikimate 1-carboxyvinyltransferase [Pajaroellobacter abortibovis]APS00116.1 3-phosphoshikimate 1-carboxyvinyltransferase [Pajaroellobacter abortibovis]
MAILIVHPAVRPLAGVLVPPVDKSIAHRALLFAALGEGTSLIRNLALDEDRLSRDLFATLKALQKMGVTISRCTGTSDGCMVRGVGLDGLRSPDSPLDCLNSGTTMRLLAGILSAQSFSSCLVGDRFLSRRPMARIVDPLVQRGAMLRGTPLDNRSGEVTAPLYISPLLSGESLRMIHYCASIPSAQVKSALLLSGLYAAGDTVLQEPMQSRDHTERMMQLLGIPLRVSGTLVTLEPTGWDRKIPSFEWCLPGDLSSIAFLIGAAQLVSGSCVQIHDVGVNPTRTGILDVLKEMEGPIALEPREFRSGEPTAHLEVRSAPLRGSSINGEMVLRSLDEIPLVCVLAARAQGFTSIRNAQELRVKESDRLANMAYVLRSFGVVCEEMRDGLEIEGKEGFLRGGGMIESKGDHRIAMAAAVLALFGDQPSSIKGAECILTSFPEFVSTFCQVGADMRLEEN